MYTNLALRATWVQCVDVEGDFNHLTYDPIEVDTRSVTITGNYRPSEKPVTLFAGYQFADIEGSVSGYPETASGNSGAIFGGVRLSFGSNSLKDEERSGPMWNVDPMPH